MGAGDEDRLGDRHQPGGRTCHAAILSRELGIPAVVGTEEATTRIPAGEEITVSCAEGDTGRIYRGALAFHVEHVTIAELPRPLTQIMVNLGDPERAFATAMLPNDGVGLARMEFVIMDSIKAHPLALAHPERITDPGVRARLARLVRGYARTRSQRTGIMADFSGRSVIVIGGARGIGAAVAAALAKEHFGVVVADLLERDGTATAESIGANATFRRLDVTDEADWRVVIGQASECARSIRARSTPR